MSKHKSLRNLITAVLGALLLIAAVLTPLWQADAQKAVAVRLLTTPQGQTKYAYLNEPASLYASSSNLYVPTADGITLFTYDGGVAGTIDVRADAAYVNGGLTVLLRDGDLTCVYGENQTVVNTGLRGFSVYDNTLYAYAADHATRSSSVYAYTVTDSGLSDERILQYSNTVITGIAAGEKNVFISVSANAGGTRDDLCVLAENGLRTVRVGTERTIRLACPPAGDTVYALYDGIIRAYAAVASAYVPSRSVKVNDVTDITAAEGSLYALTGGYAILKIPAALEGYSEFVASASAQSGFYDMPYAAVTRKNEAVIADHRNDRVMRVTDSAIKELEYPFVRPTGAAIDDYGKIYVSHRINLIDVFDASGTHVRTLETDDEILDIFTDSMDEVYVRTAKGVFTLSENGLTALYEGAVQAVSVMPESRSIYVYTAGSISLLSEGALQKVADISCDAVDFAVDIDRSFYVLAQSGMIYKYAASDSYAETLTPVRYEGHAISDGARRITLSTIRNGLIDYGDLLVTDTKAHAVKVIDAEAFAVKIIDDTVTPPVDADDDTPNGITDQSLIFQALEDISVYELPRDMSPFYTIEKGRKIIVPAYDLAESDAYSYVLVEDPQTETLLAGYVRKQRLPESSRLPYVQPPNALGTVQNDHTTIYKWPSMYAAPIEGYRDLSKGTDVKLLHFVTSFIDDSGFRWYRVEVNEGTGEGYVYASNLSINHYQPIFIRPQYNATIQATEMSQTAQLYLTDDSGAFIGIENEPPLAAGTRVEVVGAFDPSSEYTHIKYFDETLGTLDCFVRTEHLKYNGVSAMQVIVFVLIAVAVAVLVILVVHHFAVRRKKINKL